MRRDVHPAEVLLPDGKVLLGLRVFVTSHRLIGFAHDPQMGFQRVVDLELVERFSVPADRGSLPANGRLECRVYLEAATARGERATGTAWVNRGAGCGCGSPLKALGLPDGVGWSA